jgi:pre-rRNA-processing protein TSR1
LEVVGSLQNKGFKAKHSTKGALKQAAKGRLPGKSPNTSANASSAQSKIDRRNTTKQLQKSKRAALVQEARLFQGRSGVPRVVCVVELGDGTDARRCVRELADVLGEDGESLDLEGKGVVNVKCVQSRRCDSL